MKLLLDANLSRRIAPLLEDLFSGSAHISHVGLAGEKPDADFLRLADLHGPPPQVIRLERMNYSTEVAAELIRRYAIAITELERSARSVLVLRRNANFPRQVQLAVKFIF